jgi:hypothetical protein
MKFDIVISSIEKDQFILQKTIISIQKYVENYRRIIVVSNNKLTDIDGVEWFDEKQYPFTKKDVFNNLYNFGPKRNKKCSYINQLLKLYAHKIIPNLTDNILICDSDIVFIKKTKFIEDNKPLYGNKIVDDNQSLCYYKHFLLLHEDFNFLNSIEQQNLLKQKKILTGICHHIMYNKYIIEELINLIEKKHNTTFWKYYLNISKEDIFEPANCELYYNYVYKFHFDKIKIRPISWLERPAAVGKSNEIIKNFDIKFEEDKYNAIKLGHSYIAYHSYNREIISN